MRGLQVLLASILAMAAAAPAVALQPGDKISTWNRSSADERSAFLARLLGEHSNDAAGAKVRKCLDETSTVPGHADLHIDEVAKACASQGKSDRPV